MLKPMSTEIESVHGHDVLDMLSAANPPLTVAAFEAEATRRWGAEARFHTCSVGGMKLPELLSFLLARGKVVERDGRLITDPSKVCNH